MEERGEFKKKYFKNMQIGLSYMPEDKIMTQIDKRRKSRMSNNNFNVVDFDYHGNSASYSHLINSKFREPANSAQLTFGCQLRAYKSKTDCKHSGKWDNGFTNHKNNSIERNPNVR